MYRKTVHLICDRCCEVIEINATDSTINSYPEKWGHPLGYDLCERCNNDFNKMVEEFLETRPKPNE